MDLLQGADWGADEPIVRADDAVIAAAEGGDRVLRLLGVRPKRVSVVDRHPAQLHLLDLKLAAVKTLSYADYRELTGAAPSKRRRALYQRARWLLPKEADEFWLGRLSLLDRGVAFQGIFERQLASFRRFVRVVHGSRRVERFQALATERERREAYAGEWQTLLWRSFGGLLWKRWFDVGYDRLERLLFEGSLLAPPPGLSEAQFVAAKEYANHVLVVREGPLEHLRSLPADSIDAFLLGRVDRRGLEGELCRVAKPGARISFIAVEPDPRPPQGFVAQGPPRDVGWHPGLLVAAVLPL